MKPTTVPVRKTSVAAFVVSLALSSFASLILAVPAAAVSRREVDDAVERVFSSPAFQEGLESRGSSWGTLLGRIALTIWEWFTGLLRYFEELHDAAPAVFWLIFVGLALVLVAILAHIGWTLSLAFRQAPSVQGETDGEDRDERTKRFRELRDDARRAALDGRVREATHFLVLALLALLEERQVVRVAAGWTNREILGRLRLQEEVAGSLGEFSNAAERVWYGSDKIDTKGFEELDRALDVIAPRLVARADSGATSATAGRGP